MLHPLAFEAKVWCDARLSLRRQTGTSEVTGPGRNGIIRWFETRFDPMDAASRPRRLALIGTAGGLSARATPASTWSAGEIRDVATGSRWQAPWRPLPVASIVSVDAPLKSAAAKASLHALSGADLVDLESAAFAECATARGVEWAVIRAVSDGPLESLPSGCTAWIDTGGRTRTLVAIAANLLRPWRIPAVARLASTARRGLESAAMSPLEHRPRWIVFGGSFDPPHRAHLELPRRAAESIAASRLLFVPARINPLKQAVPPAPPEARLDMLRLAIGDDPRCEIRSLELDREGPSFTVDTLRSLAAEAAAADPPAELVLLVGADTALGFPRWREPEAIAELASVAVMLRPPFDLNRFHESYAAAWRDAGRAVAIEPKWVLDLGADPASSTAARDGGSEDSLPAAVSAYIREHGLYGRVAPTAADS